MHEAERNSRYSGRSGRSGLAPREAAGSAAIVLCPRIIFHNSGKMISGQSDAYRWGGRPWPPWVAGTEARPTSDFVIYIRDTTIGSGYGEAAIASKPLSGRGDSLVFPFIRHLPWWVAYRESLSRLAFPPTPLAGATAGKFLPDTFQNPAFIQTPGRRYEFIGMGVAGKAVNHQVGREPFDEVHHAIDVLCFGEADVLPILEEPGQAGALDDIK